MTSYRTKKSAFTLVEILIVVIILGILAAIVIPQFTNASQDARRSSLTSQLQTIRSQLELYKLQHLDQAPPNLSAAGSVAGATAFDTMIAQTASDHTIAAGAEFGPYLQAVPANPLRSGVTGVVVVSGADPVVGVAVPGVSANEGWVYNLTNGKFWAVDTDGTLYDEAQ